jgi:hypothetical protein
MRSAASYADRQAQLPRSRLALAATNDANARVVPVMQAPLEPAIAPWVDLGDLHGPTGAHGRAAPRGCVSSISVSNATLPISPDTKHAAGLAGAPAQYHLQLCPGLRLHAAPSAGMARRLCIYSVIPENAAARSRIGKWGRGREGRGRCPFQPRGRPRQRPFGRGHSRPASRPWPTLQASMYPNLARTFSSAAWPGSRPRSGCTSRR